MTETRDRETFYRAMDKVLNLTDGTVTGDRPLSSLRQWDSLAVLDFMMLASSDFGVEVEPAEIAPCRTFGDLGDLVLLGKPAEVAS